MTNEEIYLKFAQKNDWGDSDDILLSAKQLEKIILTACKYAREDGFTNGQEYQKRQNKMADKNSDPMGIFKDVFNNKK